MQARNFGFGKAVKRVVILRGSIHQCRVGLDPSLAQFLLNTRSILANIARKTPQCANLFFTHANSLARFFGSVSRSNAPM